MTRLNVSVSNDQHPLLWHGARGAHYHCVTRPSALASDYGHPFIQYPFLPFMYSVVFFCILLSLSLSRSGFDSWSEKETELSRVERHTHWSVVCVCRGFSIRVVCEAECSHLVFWIHFQIKHYDSVLSGWAVILFRDVAHSGISSANSGIPSLHKLIPFRNRLT
jgi:hypothetical protein